MLVVSLTVSETKDLPVVAEVSAVSAVDAVAVLAPTTKQKKTHDENNAALSAAVGNY